MDVNSLFARAEQAFVAGRIDAARADLAEVQRLAGDHSAVLHLLALVEKKGGDAEAARTAFARAVALAPDDPQINNNYANLLDALGDWEAALAHFDRAIAADARFADARYNRALLLERLGRLDEALTDLDAAAALSPQSAKIRSARGGVLRKLGRLADSAHAYDEALAIEPRRLTALHGRARVAMERGEATASHYYGCALAVRPDDLELRLGLAEALEAEGEAIAVDSLAAAVATAPDWVEGQASLARMRWEAGEGRAFTRDLERALQKAPDNRNLWLTYASSLAAAELHAEAADAAARGQEATGEEPRLRLLEAIHASEAGDLARADALFARLPESLPGAAMHEIRHRIRQKAYDAALVLAERVRAEKPWDVSLWAMIGLLWRIAGDDRAKWLHEQPGFVTARPLPLSAGELDAVADFLRTLHRTRAHPIGQSLRGGTQSRGRLFEREEPEAKRLRGAVLEAVRDFWSALPPVDADHPLLRHRERGPTLEGSWSVRLTDGGFHVAHVHPRGLLSSACYLVVPSGEKGDGWLEIGRPPPELGTGLGPLAEIEPIPGRLALFPSTLFHGTRPFPKGERLTAAFDVVAR